jgi:hypothetical protein
MGGRLVWLVLLAGCGSSRALEAEFLAALPQRQAVQVAFPNGSVQSAKSGQHSAALIGQTAEFYAVTRGTSGHLNGLVGAVLGTLGSISQLPPTTVEKERAVWGPFTPALSPVNYRLVIEHVAPNQYAYRLDGRSKSATSEEEFAPALSGTSSPERKSGSFVIDLTRLHGLDPIGTLQTGGIGFNFEMAPQQSSIRIHLQDLAGPEGPALSADYVYLQAADGPGDFLFVAHPSLSGASAELQGAAIRSRWTPAGAGRADAHVPSAEPPGGREVTECWDESFGRVFFSARPGPTEGDPARCPYAEPPPPI